VADGDVRAGEELARAWLQGKSELIDDLAALVDGMTRPLDATARAFLFTIGNAARSVPRSKVRQTPAGAPPPARLEAQTAAQPTPEAPPAPAFDVDEFRRRRREHELAARLDELGRRNAEAFVGQQRAFMASNYLPKDADWR
jgi:hypothetical protein